MIGTSIWDYIFIRTCIFFLHLVAPISTLYSLIRPLVHPPFHIPLIFEIWLSLEAVFYLVVYLPRRAYLQATATRPTTSGRDDRRVLFRRCRDHIPNPAWYLTRWFLDAPSTEIRRENLEDFMRWAFLDTNEPDPAHDEEVEEYVVEMENLLGRKLEPGRGKAKCLRLTSDKVEMLHRSLTWYLCVFVVDTMACFYLRCHSFDFHHTALLKTFSVFPLRPLTLLKSHTSPARTLTYWHRPHTSKTRLPVLFIHGIGIGLYPYIDFLADLNAGYAPDETDGELGIIAVEIMSVSFRITGQAMLKDEMCEEINCILKAHEWDKFVLVSHSYGSVIATHLLRTPPIALKIGPMLFIDPVSFLLHLPDVAYNFLHRKPIHANEYQLSYFASKDMGVSHTLFRRFFWADNILWKEDIQKHRVTVALAGRDLIVDTKVVGAYLTGVDDWKLETGAWKDGVWEGDGLDVIWFQDLDHGGVFKRKTMRGKLVDVVRRFCDGKT